MDAVQEWTVMTMRLIDADALPRLMQIFEANGKRREQEVVLAKIIDNAPTIDAVPVVRCKDCKWWTKQEKSIQGRCALTGTYPTGGWYCGNGERRDDEIDRR